MSFNTHTFPRILEINAWPWLNQLKSRYGDEITFQNLPPEILTEDTNEFDYIWMMGIWKRSSASQQIGRQHPGLQQEFKTALNDLSGADVIGSPYAIQAYQVDSFFGGEIGLKRLINQFHSMNKGLIVDYVPNHVAKDHPWVENNPEFFLHWQENEQSPIEGEYFLKNNLVFAHGKDPYFPPWTDTVQVDAFSPEYRREIISLLKKLATSGVDGVRCDMAMLLTNRIFKQTWGKKVGTPLSQEFWQDIIGNVKEQHPHFKFIAEVYWDMEWDLQQQGFDFCYDKRLYDRLLHATNEQIRAHLTASWKYQKRLIRFIENHDEPRASSVLGREKSQAAASMIYTLPGAYLHHWGQSIGRKIKLPVQLGRFPAEEGDPNQKLFYTSLFSHKFLKYGQTDALKWFFLNDLPWSFIGYVWISSSHLEILLTNYSDSDQTLRNIPLESQISFHTMDLKATPSLKWQSLQNLARSGEIALDQMELNPNLEFRPWETLYIHKSK